MDDETCGKCQGYGCDWCYGTGKRRTESEARDVPS